MAESEEAGDRGVRLEDLYNEHILRFVANITRIGRLAKPDATATVHSRLCGSTVTVDIVMDGDTFADFAHEVRACALGQTSAAIMAEHIVGATKSDVLAARRQLLEMLKHDGPPPGGRFADLAILEPVKHYKPRHAATMLPFDAVAAALHELEESTANSPAGKAG
jgi:NifU-like protein involved in Fe-S cluster formation